MTDQHTVTVSPRGYAYNTRNCLLPYFAKKEIVQVSTTEDPDPVINGLWKDVSNMTIPELPLSVMLAVTSRFTYLISDLEKWLWFNLCANPLITEQRAEFLKDCLDFAQTGKRKYDLFVWTELLNNEDNLGGNEIDYTHLLDTTFIPPIEELISNWCSKPKGVRDFIMSANILFGQLT